LITSRSIQLSTPHSEAFAERVEHLFYVKMNEGALKEIELAELQDRIQSHYIEKGTYPTDLVFKYNRIYNDEKKPLTFGDNVLDNIMFTYKEKL